MGTSSSALSGQESIKKATVLGGGAFGTAVAHVLGRRGIHVKMWVKEPEVCVDINNNHINSQFLAGVPLPHTISASNDLPEALDQTEMVFIVVPVPHLRAFLHKRHDIFPSGVPLVCCSKGIEASSLMTPSEILIEELPGKFHPFIAALSGPSFAAEMVKEMPTSVVVACKQIEVAEKVQAALSEQHFRVYTGKDVIGAEICGAMKNVIAIACGAADGLGFHKNTSSLLIAQGLSEMSQLTLAKGGEISTIMGLAGVGDLVLTCTSTKSRNFSFGQRLAKGEKRQQIVDGMKMISEGVHTSKSLKALSAKMNMSLPLCDTVFRCVWEDEDVPSAMKDLYDLPLRSEHDPLTAYSEYSKKHCESRSKL